MDQPRIEASRPYGPITIDRYFSRGNARVRLTWNEGPGDNITYKVQIWDRVGPWPSPFYEFKDLPVSGFSLSGPYASDEVDGQLHAMVGNLNFDHHYEFRIVAVRGEDEESTPTEDDEHDVYTPPPFYGRQADHTVQYVYGEPFPTRTASDPIDYELDTILEDGIEHAIHAWNNSPVGASIPNLRICENGSECSGRKNDGRLVTIRFEDCDSRAQGCVEPDRTGSLSDSSSHMSNLLLRLDDDVRGVAYNGPVTVEVRFLWTNTSRLDNEKHPNLSNARYLYLPSVVMHEFGHTFGLYDLYHKTAKRFVDLKGSLMNHDDPVESIPSDDVTYIREIYGNHEPHGLSTGRPPLPH